MLEFKDFYDIAEYGNKVWKGYFSPKEIVENAYSYLCEFKASKENGIPTNTIKELAKLLAEDGSEECKDWLYEMATELGLLDMNFMDYMETDEDIVTRFLAEKTSKNENEITKEMAENFYNDLCGTVYGDSTKNCGGVMSVELIADRMEISVEKANNFCNAMIKFGITERQNGMIVV